MKNASKSKFLTCFRPVDDIDNMLESRDAVHRSASRRFSCIPVADHKHETENSETKPMLLNQECPKYTENWVVPQPPKRTLAKVIKAVVFETILNKRAHQKNRYSQGCFGSKRYSTYTRSSSTGDKRSMLNLASVGSNIKEMKAPELSLPSSSSSSSVSESKNLSKYDPNKDQLEKQKKFNCTGMFLVLLILIVTVFWGKGRGIILTSIWLCLFSLCSASYRRLKEAAKLSNTHNPKLTP